MRTLICAANPKSRNGKVGASLPKLEGIIASATSDTPLVLDLTTPEFSQQLIDGLAAAENPVVMGVGGDGTHYSLLNTLMALRESEKIASVPYALCPMGTGNDLAKSIGLSPGPSHFYEAVQTALHGPLQSSDLGRCGGTVFADMLSVGLDVEVLSTREKLADQLRNYPKLNTCVHGYLIYALASLTMLKGRGLEISVSIDGQDVFDGHAAGVLINNCPVHAGEFLLTPGASMTDGLLDLRIFSGKYNYAQAFIRGWRHLPEILRESDVGKHFKGKTMTLTAHKAVPVQIDGELAMDESELTVTVMPGAVDVCVPGA